MEFITFHAVAQKRFEENHRLRPDIIYSWATPLVERRELTFKLEDMPQHFNIMHATDAFIVSCVR